MDYSGVLTIAEFADLVRDHDRGISNGLCVALPCQSCPIRAECRARHSRGETIEQTIRRSIAMFDRMKKNAEVVNGI